MADHAVLKQLPIMARKPKAGWPRLAEMGLYRKQIAGDGNCLFASLSDQIYGSPNKHAELRQLVVEYMRAHRQDFEGYVTADSVVRRRSMRARESDSQNKDTFEEYLKLMATNGSYGGEPELVAFCRAWNRDVIIHRPTDQHQDSERITNTERPSSEQVITINISYGDEETRAHYDSVRKFEPRQAGRRRSAINSIETRQPYQDTNVQRIEALQRAMPSIPPEEIHAFLEKGRRDLDASFQQLLFRNRARSSSRSSSQRSSSSKRSLDEDGEPRRASKRADRRISLRNRTVALVSSLDRGAEVSFRIRVESPESGTPASTQDTDSLASSPRADGNSQDDDYRESTAELSDSDIPSRHPSYNYPHSPSRLSYSQSTSIPLTRRLVLNGPKPPKT